MRIIYRSLVFGLVVSALAAGGAALAGSFSANFDDLQVPPGTTVDNAAVVENSTLNNVTTGVVKLTKAVNSQLGGFSIDDLDGGQPVNGFDLKFKLRVGGGSSPPADGYSVCFGSGVSGAFGEEGIGEGLIVSFDTYDNVDGDPNNPAGEAPAVDLKWGGQTLVSTRVPLNRLRSGSQFWDVNIHLDPDGSVDVTLHTNQFYKDFVIAGFTAIAGARYGIGARTGGATDNHWIDDVVLTTTTGPVTLAWAVQPADAVLFEGRRTTFRPVVNDLTSVTGYQWQRKAPGASDFSDLPGEVNPTYTTDAVAPADSGTQYRVVASGVNNNATSAAATVTVISIPVPPPKATVNFNDGQVPANGKVLGVAYVWPDGGVDNSGVLHLTDAINDQRGAFYIQDLDDGKNVESIVVTFKVLVGGGSIPPADGFSFSWSATAPTSAPTTAEDGFGGALRVAFDIYDNGGLEAPAVELRRGTTVLATKKVPIEVLETGMAFADVLVRLERDGTVDVAYNGEVLLHNVTYPNWTALAAGKFVWAARTGGLNENHWIDDIAIATTLQAVAPTLALARDATGLTLTYTGVLQAADTVTGTFTDVQGAASPYPVRTDAPAKFFRTRAP
jgi:hypothetical protein